MNPMEAPFRRFAWTLVIVWAILAAAATVYAGILGLPARMATPVIAAIL